MVRTDSNDLRIRIVVRSFQGGAGISRDWNPDEFDRGVRVPVAEMIRTAPPALQGFVFVSCGDTSSPLCEAVDRDGKNHTLRALDAAFPEYVRSGYMKTLLCTDWGQNAGSAAALNVGVSAIDDASHMLSWNPDFKLTGHTLASGLDHLRRFNLQICGFYRKRWYERFQWGLFQNTATVYDLDLIRQNKGFSVRCDGHDGEVVQLGDASVRIMGMDDFHFYLRASKRARRLLPWGMYGVLNPSDWETEFPQDILKQAMFDEKVARQMLVMMAWAKEVMPRHRFMQLMDRIFEQLRAV